MAGPFTEVIVRGEEPILARILADAEANGYPGFSPPDPEAWRPVVRGISGSLVQAFRHSADPPSLSAGEMGKDDGLTAFLVVEARKYRLAGMPLGVFLCMMKIFRRAYAELVGSAGFPPEEGARNRTFVERFFDRNEIASCVSWSTESRFEHAEELLGKHEEFFRIHDLVATAKEEWEGTIDCVDDMLLLAGADGRIRRCNRSFRRFVGRPYSEIVGRPYGQTLRDAGMPAELAGGRGIEHFHERTGKWFVLNLYPFREPPGEEIAGTVVVIRDSTEARNAAGEMERRYAQMKEELSELRRTHGKSLEQERMDSAGQLAAGVAHDIRQPIGVVVGNLATLRKYLSRLTEFLAEQSACIGAGSPERMVDAVRRKREELRLDYILKDLDDLVAETFEGADRVRAIAGELKDFSRPEEGDLRQADINECLRDAIQAVREEIKGKTTLNREFGAIPRTRCLPLQMTRVFQDLLVNAARSAGSRGTVTLRSWQEDGFVCVSVGDTGGEDGSDLTIARDIVRKHGGEVRVRREPGSGTTRTVLVPVVMEA
jgi:two-component system NtrC family sensor kinase